MPHGKLTDLYKHLERRMDEFQGMMDADHAHTVALADALRAEVRVLTEKLVKHEAAYHD